MLFLTETKMDDKRMQWFRWSLGPVNMMVKDCEGKGGGIAVLWRRGVDVTLRNYSKYHIDMDIREDDGVLWRLTGIYGEPRSDLRERMWQTLRYLITVPVTPWLSRGISMRCSLRMRRKEGDKEAKGVWMFLEKHWRNVGWKILVMKVICLPGGIISSREVVSLGSGWIELWQTRNGGPCFLKHKW